MRDTVLFIQHALGEQGGLLETICEEKGWRLEICPLFQRETLPASFRDYGVILIAGGPMCLRDEKALPLLKKEILFIRQALKIDHPVLGIGQGAQLMARALGETASRGLYKEIGWYWVNQTPQARLDPLFSQMDPFLLVFQWHQEAITLPRDAVCLAGNRAFPNQAFRIGSHSYGLQFHLEVTERMIKTWLSSCAQEIPMAAPQTVSPEDILNDAPIYLHRLHDQARIFFSGYLDRVRNYGKERNSFLSFTGKSGKGTLGKIKEDSCKIR